MFKEELKKQLVKNRLALLLIIVIAVDALYSLFSSVKPDFYIDLMGQISEDVKPYYSAWSFFVNNDTLNWALLIFICVVTLKIWVDEYRLNMQMYNLTSVKGRASLAGKKVLITLGLVLPAALLSDFIRILMYGINLSFADLPLKECGMAYETTEFSLTALQTCFISVALHILGYLLFCGFCIFTAVLIRSSVNCLGANLAIILIPLYIFDDLDARLRLPFPVSFLQGEYMFSGSIIDAAGTDSETPIYFYKALNTEEIVLNVILGVLLAVALIAVSVMIFSGVRLKFKKVKAAAVTLAVLMLFSGCSNSGLPKEEKSGYISLNDFEHIYSKERNEVFSINPTPFTNWDVMQIYGNYAIVNEKITPDNPNGNYYIKAINLDDFSETLLYTNGKEADFEGMMGLDDVINLPGWLLYNDEGGRYSSSFVFADNKLYFRGNEDLLCVDLSNGTKTRLFEDNIPSCIAITDEGIYYTNKDDGMLYLNSSENRVLDFPVGAFAVGENVIAAVDLRDGCLYLITETGKRKITDMELQGIWYTSEDITVFDAYYGNGTGGATFAFVDGSLKDYGEWAHYADEDGVYFLEEGKVTVQGY